MKDHSLQRVALNFRNANRANSAGNLYESSMTGVEYLGPRSRRISVSSDTPQSLDSPPLSVLLDPRHIVICSFLGEESLASLQWFIIPLRAAHAKCHPPITIIDAAEPSPVFMHALSSFADVVSAVATECSAAHLLRLTCCCSLLLQYYIRGSPLIYSELQRAGAKAAAAVIVLGKRTSSVALSFSAAEADLDLESSIVDAEAIFTTMLVELKMDFSKIFTITELSDESNSKFMGMSFQLKNLTMLESSPKSGNPETSRMDVREGDSEHFWDYILLNDVPKHKSEKAVFGLPLYMSGRLLHPELCENMLVQVRLDVHI